MDLIMPNTNNSTAPTMATPYGLIALFEKTPDVYHAAEKVRDAGYQNWDVISPFPIHGIQHAMGLPRSKVPIFSLFGGLTGFTTGMLIAYYMGAVDYPLIVGGKPFFSPIFPFPIAYELTILLAAFGAFFGQFITNRLPQHHHPIMNYARWAELTDDKFAIVIEAIDPKFDSTEIKALFQHLGASEISEVTE
jgi:hypothetical protein